MQGHRRAFTLIELIIVTIFVGVGALLALPKFVTIVNHARANKAQSQVAADMELATALAQREQRPTRLSFDSVALTYQIADRSNGAVYLKRIMDSKSEYRLLSLRAHPSRLDFFPTGVTAGAETVWVAMPSYTRSVAITSAGQVRMGNP